MKSLSSAKQLALNLANESGHGKAFVISYPEKLLTTQYLRKKQDFSFLDYAKNSSPSQSIGLYIHLPFCEQKCSFCNFAVSTNQNQDYQTKYLDNILKEMDLFFQNYQGKVHSVDIGGGTPLLMSTENLTRLSQFLKPIITNIPNYNATKFSFEQTSKIATFHPEKMSALISAIPSNYPVRTSMGIQTISSEILQQHKRSGTNIGDHDLNPAKNCRSSLPSSSHLSADLIFPLGNTKDFIATVNKTIELGYDTITAYDLIDNYGGGTRKSFRGKSNFSKESYLQFYSLFYILMITNDYILRYGSNNAIKKSTLTSYLRDDPRYQGKELTDEIYLDAASEYAVSHYYHDRISLGNEFIGFGVGASSKLRINNHHHDGNTSSQIVDSFANDFVWTFNQPNLTGWMQQRSSSSAAAAAVPFTYSYQFPREIWMTKDIRYQLANYGCIQFSFLENKYSLPRNHLQEMFEQEIAFVLESGWMYWDGDDRHRLCLRKSAYHYLAHIRALFTDEILLSDIVQLYSNEEFLQEKYAKRQEIEKQLAEGSDLL